MTEAWATVMTLAIAAVVVIGGAWACQAWLGFRRRRRHTVPEMAVRTLRGLGLWFISLAEVLDSTIICWRDTMHERRTLLTRSEVDRELRKTAGIQKAMEAWRR